MPPHSPHLGAANNRTSLLVLIHNLQFPNLALLNLVRMLSFQFRARLDVVCSRAWVVAFDDADDVVAGGVGEGYVCVPALERLVGGRERESR